MTVRTLGGNEAFAEYEAAVERGSALPHAASVRYDPRKGRVELELTNGCLFACPVTMLQCLAGATREQLRQVEVMPGALDIYWEELDIGLSVPNLVAGTFGTREWMSQLGRAGGRARTAAKDAAVRANGRKGGRPRGTASTAGD